MVITILKLFLFRYCLGIDLQQLYQFVHTFTQKIRTISFIKPVTNSRRLVDVVYDVGTYYFLNKKNKKMSRLNTHGTQ